MRLGLGLGIVKSAASIYKGILDKFPNAVAAYSTRKLKTSYPTTLPADYGGGAAAAYSLRKVKSDYGGSAVKVRRSSDGELQDIGFDNNGNLDTTALLAFVNASGNAYTSDFRVIGDPPIDQEDMVEVGGTGVGGQSIADVSDAYKFTQDSSTGIHRAANPTNTNIVGGNISVSFDYYLPSGQTANRILFRTSDAGDAQVDLTTTDAWTTYTTTFSGIAGDSFLFYSAIIGQGLSFTGNGSDHFYLKNIVVTQTDADGHVTRWYSQSDPVDTYTADFSGGADNFVGNANNTPTGGLSITDEYGTTIDNVLELNCDNTNDTEHPLRKNNPFGASNPINGKTLKCSFKMLVPSGQTGLVSAALSDGNLTTGGILSDGKVTEQGRWTTFTDVAWTQTALQSRLIFMGLDSSDDPEFVATAGEKFYIADVVLTETTDAYNGTDSQQPLIVSGGTLVEENGKAAILSAPLATQNLLRATFTLPQPLSIIGVVKTPLDRDQVPISSQNTTLRVYRRFATSNNFLIQAGSNIFAGSQTLEQSLEFTVYNGSSGIFALDGNLLVSANFGTNGLDNLDLFQSNGALPSYETYLQEVIVFASDQSANRKDIEWNINNHYSIYDQWDRESCMNVRRSSDNATQDIGFSGKNINQTQLESFVNDASPVLDDYTGDDAAAAAYSLRKVRSAYTGSAIKVRRSSDDALQDIGFDANGDLDTTALLDFVGGQNLLVQSNQFDTSPWTDPNADVTGGQEGRDGTTDAWELSLTGTFGQTTQLVSASGTNTLSFYAKSGTSDFVRPYIAGPNKYAYFDLLNGQTGAQTGVASSIEDAGNGWWRCSFTVTGAITDVRIHVADSISTVGTTTSGSIYIQDAQLEEGSTATTYNPTTTGIGGNGHVTTWYDQSGNGNDATNATESEQPLVVSGGSVVIQGEKTSIDFGTISENKCLSLNTSSTTNFITIVHNVTYRGTKNQVLLALSNSNYIIIPSADGGKLKYANSGDNMISTTNVGTFQLSTIDINDGKLYTNGSEEDSVTTASGATTRYIIGNYTTTSGNQLEGYVSELIIFDSNQSTNRLSIEGNIGRYYNITGYRDGFVTKWYDQSGEYNHAENSTHDEQPQVVSNGSMLKENGKAAIEFSGNPVYLDASSAISDAFTGNSVYYKFEVAQVTSTSKGGILSANVGYRGFFNPPSYDYANFHNPNGLEVISSLNVDRTNQFLFSESFDANTGGGTYELYGNGSLERSQGSEGTSNLDTPTSVHIGRDPSGGSSAYLVGKIQEAIFFNSDQSSNRTDIEKNINTHFKIYS